VFERLGIEKDETKDYFNVDKSWANYLEKYQNAYCICLHRDNNGNGGTIVWFGDRSYKDKSLSFVFCKMLNFGATRTQDLLAAGAAAQQQLYEEFGDKAHYYNESTGGPSHMVILTVLVLIVAVVVKVAGWV